MVCLSMAFDLNTWIEYLNRNQFGMVYISDILTSKVRAEILLEMIEWGPLCITDLFQNKSVAYFNPK